MNILIASDLYAPTINGVATFSQSLARGLSQRGHKVMVIAPSTKRRTYTESENGYTIRRLWSVPLRLYPIRVVLRPGDEIKQAMEAFVPDVVHVNTALEIGRIALLEARRRAIPVVLTNHAMPENVVENVKLLLPIKYPIDRIMRMYGSYLNNLANVVTTPTKSAIEVLSMRGQQQVVSNGVDTDRFKPGPPDPALAQHFKLPSDAPIVTFVGRLDGEKHLDVFIRALAILQATQPVRGLLVGKGTARAQLEELARQLDISKDLTFTGFVADEDLPTLYRLSTIFAISSPAELQSIATLEAVASGLPIVAADAAALPELCRDNHNGLLFDTDNPADMAAAIQKLIDQPKLCHTMSIASRAIALEHSLDKTLNTYEHMYAELVKNPTPRPVSRRFSVRR